MSSGGVVGLRTSTPSRTIKHEPGQAARDHVRHRHEMQLQVGNAREAAITGAERHVVLKRVARREDSAEPATDRDRKAVRSVRRADAAPADPQGRVERARPGTDAIRIPVAALNPNENPI